MNEAEALSRMIAPGQVRPCKPYRGGVIQILVTSNCNMSCFGCTQNSQLRQKLSFMSPEHFEQAVLSLKGYFGVYGVFGGNPALSPHFAAYCEILKTHVPFNQRGLWCNHPLGKGRMMRETFDPSISNLNVHLDHEAYRQFKRDWPECGPVGLTGDSQHSPCLVSMKDIGVPEEERWQRISECDVNRLWSAMIGVFRGQLRAWFCEVAGAQAILHQHEDDYPDTGVPISSHEAYRQECTSRGLHNVPPWWQLNMTFFASQVRKHCHDCGVPMRGHGERAQAGAHGTEQVSAAHLSVFKPKQMGRKVELVTLPAQLGAPLKNMVKYLQNVEK